MMTPATTTTNGNSFTTRASDKISVDEFLVDLIPGFIKNKMEDLVVLRKAVADRDFDQIRKIGHNWKGVCSSYGFAYLGEVGKQFEILAASKDADRLKSLIESIPEYLKNVEIESVADEDGAQSAN